MNHESRITNGVRVVDTSYGEPCIAPSWPSATVNAASVKESTRPRARVPGEIDVTFAHRRVYARSRIHEDAATTSVRCPVASGVRRQTVWYVAMRRGRELFSR